MASFLGYCCTPFGRRLNTALPHKMASFLEISTELLIQIYEELSVEEAQIFLGQRQSDLVRTHKFQQVGLSILLVNKQIFREARSIIYRRTTFTLVLIGRHDASRADRYGIPAQLASKIISNYARLQAVRLCIPLEFCLTDTKFRLWFREQMQEVYKALSKTPPFPMFSSNHMALLGRV